MEICSSLNQKGEYTATPVPNATSNMVTDKPGDYEPHKHFMSKQIQVSQLLATPDAQYINGDVSGHLTQIRPPNGRGPSKAKLQDATGFIEVSLWGGGVSHWEGKQVTFSGKGMQIKEFRGAKQLSVGDKVMISQAVEPDNIPGDPPAYTPPPKARQSSQTAPREPSSLPVNLPNPACVGMCVKMAGDFLLREDGWNGETAGRIEAIAQKLIEVCQRLERGENPSVPF